ncbi:MAG: hypothetical protein KKD77_23545 [Gammaproteobacteria bacterium]|nr:hypothetical protein [Gammaproteobacteria bacterium]
MAMQQLQLNRTIWMMAKASGGQVMIDEAEMDPLWEIKYERPEDSKTKLLVKASAMPTPTEEQIEMLAKRLIGTGTDPRQEAVNVGLLDYPIAYLTGRLSPLIVWNETKWLVRSEYDKQKQNQP